MREVKTKGRVVRSSLAVPGSNAHMMEKSLTVGADEIFFDLEDAVAPAAKDRARTMVSAMLATDDLGPHIQAVRINAVGSGLAHKDIVEVVEAGGENLDRIILPKARDAMDVRFVDLLLREIETALGLERQIGLEVLVESASGAMNCLEIATASSRVVGLIFGGGDYSADLGIERSIDFGIDRDATNWPKSVVVNAAVAAGVAPIDGPYPGLRDEGGFRRACLDAQRIGFRSKWCVHPAQVPWCNEAFGVSQEDLTLAKELLAEYGQALSEGLGAISFRGRLVDEATRKHAERTVQLAEMAVRKKG